MKLFPREKYLKKIRGFYHDTKLLKLITGIKHCGKFSLMKVISDELIALGINAQNIHFIDLSFAV